MASPAERLQQLDQIEKDIANALQSAGNSFSSQAKVQLFDAFCKVKCVRYQLSLKK